MEPAAEGLELRCPSTLKKPWGSSEGMERIRETGIALKALQKLL